MARPAALAIQRDGRIVLGGAFTEVNGTPVPKLVRLLADGTLDPAFDASTTDGVATAPVAIVVQPDGKILAGGAVQMSPYGPLPVIRLLANGTLDTAFTQRITALTPVPAFRALALQDDGRIVGVGSFTLTQPDVVNAVRLKADGSVDADAFVISRANGPINAVAAQTDRGLVLGGDFVTMTPREGPRNTHRYLGTTSPMKWGNAETQAQVLGGHLVAINSPAEQEFLAKTYLPAAAVGQRPVWIGFTDMGVEGLFAWSTGEPVTFTNWAPGQPDDSDFAVMNLRPAYNGGPAQLWDDVPESGLSGFGPTLDGLIHGIIEIDPRRARATSTAWVAGRDLARNERAGAVTELTNPNGTCPSGVTVAAPRRPAPPAS